MLKNLFKVATLLTISNQPYRAAIINPARFLRAE